MESCGFSAMILSLLGLYTTKITGLSTNIPRKGEVYVVLSARVSRTFDVALPPIVSFKEYQVGAGDRYFVEQVPLDFIGFLFVFRTITPTLYLNRQQLLHP